MINNVKHRPCKTGDSNNCDSAAEPKYSDTNSQNYDADIFNAVIREQAFQIVLSKSKEYSQDT